MHQMRLAIPIALPALLLLAGPVACGPGFQLVGPRIDRGLARELSQRTYPEQAERGEALDIMVTTRANTLTLTNRTPHSYEDVELWLNREHVHAYDRIRIGTNPRVRLADFINHLGEPFPTAGLFTPEAGERLVLAELYVPETGLRHHLLVELEDE